MKKLLLFLTIIITFSCIKSQLNTKKATNSSIKEKTTTYYLIRHAEKDTIPANNPKLLISGQERAKNYAAFFKNKKLDAVYSTNFTRTKNTALPTAKSHKLETTIYHPFNIDYKSFFSKTKGKSVLIVGHSNTIPEFANAIIGTNEYQEIDENVYNIMYIITIINGEIKHELKTLD